MFRVVLAVAVLAIGSGCATKSADQGANRAVAEKTPVMAENAAPTQKTGEKVVCREEMVTNSRLRKNKICLTEAGWHARRDGARDKWEEMRRPETAVTGPGTN